jgi:Ca2+-binding EF-hand superfamily protein
LKEAFELFDTGRNNAIDARELKAVMKAFGLEVKKDDVRQAMKAIGKEVTDTIVFDEFLKIMAPRIVYQENFK